MKCSRTLHAIVLLIVPVRFQFPRLGAETLLWPGPADTMHHQLEKPRRTHELDSVTRVVDFVD